MFRATSRVVGKFQTTVPPRVRDLFRLQEDDFLEWGYDEKLGVLTVRPMRAAQLKPAIDKAMRAALESARAGGARRWNSQQQAEITEEVVRDSENVEA